MQRINSVDYDSSDAQTQEILTAVKSKMGMVPNLISALSQSTAAVNSYLAFSQNLSEGVLPARLREQIALAVGEANSCGYCVSAHSMIAKGAGLSTDEVAAARGADASDEKERAALQFVQAMVRERGRVSDSDFENLRNAGFGDTEIVEIVAHVALNTFTNYFNHVANTEIDFPLAPALATA